MFKQGDRVRLLHTIVSESVTDDGEVIEFRDLKGTHTVVMEDQRPEDGDAVLLDLPVAGQWFVPEDMIERVYPCGVDPGRPSTPPPFDPGHAVRQARENWHGGA